MAKSKSISANLEEVLASLVAWFRTENIKNLIIGGIAASYWGRARLTEDIDALVLLDVNQWDSLIEGGKKYHFIPRIADPLTFAKRSRVLLLKHAKTGIEIDVSLGALPFEEESLKRGVNVKVGTVSCRLPTPEDLIIMKAVAHRPIDAFDIANILQTQPKLDPKRIRKWVREFAKVLEMPSIYGDLNKLLKKAGL